MLKRVDWLCCGCMLIDFVLLYCLVCVLVVQFLFWGKWYYSVLLWRNGLKLLVFNTLGLWSQLVFVSGAVLVSAPV